MKETEPAAHQIVKNMDNPWSSYIGNHADSDEVITGKDLLGLAALLDYPVPADSDATALPWPDDTVPPFAHWLNANPQVAQGQLGDDGHPRKGGFLPPIAFPRRMWAGSRVKFLQSVAVGQPLRHRKTIVSIASKTGRSGPMVFVTLRHDFYADDNLAICEEQDIVYRESITTPLPAPTIKPAAEIIGAFTYDWSATVTPDPVLLFRYSAITGNAHRIHYDRSYAQAQEGYPGLVVQGPLTATLLLDLFQRNNPHRQITGFSFVGRGPLFDGNPVYLMGRQTAAGAELWALAPDGVVAMTMQLSTGS